MQFHQTLAGALLLAGYASAYKLTFWNGEQCTGEETYSISDVVDVDVCYTSGMEVGNAKSIEITKEDNDPSGSMFAFYSSGSTADCTSGELIMIANNGCADYELLGAKSYILERK
ncbi:hypothetical protein LTR85_003413 [Meristemomyces frigidus]|nr:hypothetical protein LTR85_003413 [Meristemomyces frigidus]